MRAFGKKSRYKFEAATLLGLCLVVYMPWGCSKSPLAPGVPIVESTFVLPDGTIAYPGIKQPDTNPASPDSALAVPKTGQLESEDLDTSGTTGNVTEIGTYAEEIDSLGGSVAMDVNDRTSYFYVPREALSERTSITIEVYRDYQRANEVVTEFHFGPKGLTFSKTAQLVFPTTNPDGETMDLLWWDEARQQWMHSAEAIVVSGYATFPVTHFSKYRTTDRISLGGQRAQ
jgi:hypothetical protein